MAIAIDADVAHKRAIIARALFGVISPSTSWLNGDGRAQRCPAAKVNILLRQHFADFFGIKRRGLGQRHPDHSDVALDGVLSGRKYLLPRLLQQRVDLVGAGLQGGVAVGEVHVVEGIGHLLSPVCGSHGSIGFVDGESSLKTCSVVKTFRFLGQRHTSTLAILDIPK